MPPDAPAPPGWEDFDLAAQRHKMPVERLISREVHGSDDPVYGYTTPEQAIALVGRLKLRPGVRLLDIGAGRGWPSVKLAGISGCAAVLTDVPTTGLREAMKRARREGITAAFVRASGGDLPFRPGSFDAVVHTDVL